MRAWEIFFLCDEPQITTLMVFRDMGDMVIRQHQASKIRIKRGRHFGNTRRPRAVARDSVVGGSEYVPALRHPRYLIGWNFPNMQ